MYAFKEHLTYRMIGKRHIEKQKTQSDVERISPGEKGGTSEVKMAGKIGAEGVRSTAHFGGRSDG